MTTGEVELTSYDDNIAAALTAFSKFVKGAAKAAFQGFLSTQEAEVRRQHLLQIANDAEALARHPPTATYQAFERLINTAHGWVPIYRGKRSLRWVAPSFAARMCGQNYPRVRHPRTKGGLTGRAGVTGGMASEAFDF